jgi:DNA polymerase-3 subunit beta
MKIEINKDQLMEAIGIADSIIPSRSVNAILSNCLFNVIKDEIEIISTDNEIGIKTRVEAVADGEVSFTAEGKRFYSILKELPRGTVYLEVNSSSALDITSKAIKGHYKLLGTSAEDYPDLPAFYNKDEVEIKQSEFKSLIKKVMYAAAADNLKPVYNGIYIVPDSSKKITFVATDSRRLAIITKEMEVPVEIEEGVIIPLKTIHELFRLLTAEGMCGLSITKNQCFFRINDTEVMSRVIDGQFPNYKQVIPKEYQNVVTVQTDRFLNSLRRAMIFTQEPSNRVILHFSGEKLIIEARTPDLGEAEEEIPVESDLKENISIGINAQFLLEALREMESNTVAVGITGQMSPLTITPDNNKSYISVIMPIKIKSSDED